MDDTQREGRVVDVPSFGTGAGPVDSDAASVRAVVQRAVHEFFANIWRGGPFEPPHDLRRLLVDGAAVLSRDEPLEQARLLLITGLVHDFARDVAGADQCYADAARLDPAILRRGVLAEIRKTALRGRGRNAVLMSSSPQPCRSRATNEGGAPTSRR
ncbi:hypothetical protein WMF31_37720 [Sorangium sp. So ce1036]|uniref:hypothetical protein n=1 Tax=Sorangium sp. So ce1036 TaxID=3133328 RepID=UPI003F015EED